MRDSKILIVFDCFGVILNAVTNEWFCEFKKPEKREELLKIFDMGDRGVLKLDEVIKESSKLVGANPIETKEYWYKNAKPIELVSILPNLKKKYAIAMLSNATENLLDDFIDKFNLSPLFDEIVISSHIKMAKPDKEIFEYVLNKMGNEYDVKIFVDDNHINVEASTKSGFIGIVYKDFDSFKKEISKYINI